MPLTKVDGQMLDGAITATAAGNVGIGTTTPDARLRVAGAANALQARFANVNGRGLAISTYAASGTGDNGVIYNAGLSSDGEQVWQCGGTERMRIDGSGNVGLGTVSPSSALQISRTGAASLTTSSTSGGGNWEFGADAGGNGFIYSGQSKYLAVSTSGSERMRIDSSGNLLVGTTSANSGGLTLSAPQNNLGCSSYFPGTSVGTHWRFGSNGFGAVGSITTSASATTYSTSSDYRLKENIAPMTGALGLVQQLKPVTYNWKVDGSASQGFIAHELQAVVPDCVTGEKDAVETVDDVDAEGRVIGTKEVPRYQGIDTSFLVATLTCAIQELKSELDSVKAELAALKT